MPKLMTACVVAFVLAASVPGLGAQVAKGTNYVVNADAPECKVSAPCQATLTLTAQNGFHVNKDYPYKLKADDNGSVEFLGTDAGGRNVFSKAAGDFKLDDKDTARGVLTIKYKVAKSGAAKISGKFKLSVCSDQNCQMDTADVSIPIVAR